LGALGRAPTALACYNLVSTLKGSDDDGLDNPVLGNTCRQFIQLFIGKMPPWLIGIGTNVDDRQACHALAARVSICREIRRVAVAPQRFAQQGIQAAAKAHFLLQG
jgi:hypothetical protein